MKLKILFLSVFILLSFSCHKSKNSSKKTCGGFFIYCHTYTGGGSSGITYSLHTMDSTGQETSNIFVDPVFGYNYGKGVYDAAKNYYYMYASSSSSGISFYRFPVLYGYAGKYTSTICDTLTNWQQNELLCNSTASKLYFVSHGPHVDRIYRIDTTGSFSETQIFASDSVGAISSPVVDENTGYIYFFSSPYLIKFDPVSGISSAVTTYTNVRPDQLQYDTNDGMFYGINIYAKPYTFIRINPENGSVTTYAQMSYYTVGMGHTFDPCENRYIVYGDAVFTSWIDPLTGNVVKTTGGGGYNSNLTYINGQ